MQEWVGSKRKERIKEKVPGVEKKLIGKSTIGGVANSNFPFRSCPRSLLSTYSSHLLPNLFRRKRKPMGGIRGKRKCFEIKIWGKNQMNRRKRNRMRGAGTGQKKTGEGGRSGESTQSFSFWPLDFSEKKTSTGLWLLKEGEDLIEIDPMLTHRERCECREIDASAS